MIEEAIRLYNSGLSCLKVAKVINMSESWVENHLKKNGVVFRTKHSYESRRKYKIDDNLFNNIDEPWKAYFLGWIWSDGCLYKTRITLCLSEIDKDILDYFNSKIFNGKKQYARIVRDIHYINKIPCPPSISLSFYLYSEKISSNLRKLGLTERKSFTVTFPPLEEKYIKYFIRGVFEGDGCIHLNKNKHQKEVSICSGSLKFIQTISEILSKNNIKNTLRQNKNLYGIHIGDYDNIFKFYNYIYDDKTFKLKRKYDKFKEILLYKEEMLALRSSKEKYIIFCKTFKKWIFRIKGKFLGSFKTEELAIAAKKDYYLKNNIVEKPIIQPILV